MTDIPNLIERLLDISDTDDHKRGCQGREYSCDCGFDERTITTAREAADALRELRKAYEAAKENRNFHYERAEAAEARVKELEAALEDKQPCTLETHDWIDWRSGYQMCTKCGIARAALGDKP